VILGGTAWEMDQMENTWRMGWYDWTRLKGVGKESLDGKRGPSRAGRANRLWECETQVERDETSA